jgi:uncharacterized membrane protein YfcA
MVLAAIPFGLGNPRRRGDMAQGEAARDRVSSRAWPPACPPLQLARDLAAGLLIGATTGFFGVGGGFLIVPTLAIALALALRLAVGTSLVILTSTSLMALVALVATYLLISAAFLGGPPGTS